MTTPQYITDSNGTKLSVVLPIKAYEDILKQLEELENLEDVRLYDEAKKADDGERILFTDYLKNGRQKMPEYIVALSKLAEKQLDRMNDTTAYPILDAIAKLSQNPRPHGYTHLTGRNGYRIRVGDYRIIYEVTDKVLLVEVIDIGDRKNVYE